MERAEDVKDTSPLAADIRWILEVYANTIETLEKIAETARSMSDAELATDCLNRVRS